MKIRRLNRSDETMAAIEVMAENEKYQNDPMVGIFWYDVDKDELFGVRSTFAEDMNWYYSNQFKSDVKTDKRLHKDIWKKEFFRGKDKRFHGDHTLVPRGRVFEFPDKFCVYVGDWFDEYPSVSELVIDEFQLPADNTEFVKDVHWNIGHGWSDEF